MEEKNIKLISKFIKQNASVLDLGCGEGELLSYLKNEKNIKGYGVDIKFNNILACTKKGISTFQGNLDEGLTQFQDQSYDIVILSLTLQQVQKPLNLLNEMCRVGKQIIVTFPNFGYWKVRTSLLFFGKMPVTKTLPNTWYNTPNLHMCTIKDLFKFCDEKNINIKQVVGVNEDKTSSIKKSNLEIKNLFSKLGIFLIG